MIRGTETSASNSESNYVGTKCLACGGTQGSNKFTEEGDGDYPVSNWRLIQKLGDRTVYHIVEQPRGGGGTAGIVILILILIGVGIGLFLCHRQGKLIWNADGKPQASSSKDTEFSNVQAPAATKPAENKEEPPRADNEKA